MAPSRRRGWARHAAPALLRHGRRLLLTAGLLLAAWLGATAAAHADDDADEPRELQRAVSLAAEVPGTLAEAAAEKTAPVEEVAGAAANAAGRPEEALQSAVDALPVEEQVSLEPVAGAVAGAGGSGRSAADEKPERESTPDASRVFTPQKRDDRQAGSGSDGENRTPAAVAAVESEPSTAVHADAGSAAQPDEPAEAPAGYGDLVSATAPNPASAGSLVFGDLTRAPGIPADAAGPRVRALPDHAAATATPDEPSTSPD